MIAWPALTDYLFFYQVVQQLEIDVSKLQTKPGPKGDKGVQGPQGIKGDLGIPGNKGITGPKGDRGTIGRFGSTGQKGEMGKRGLLYVEGIKCPRVKVTETDYDGSEGIYEISYKRVSW